MRVEECCLKHLLAGKRRQTANPPEPHLGLNLSPQSQRLPLKPNALCYFVMAAELSKDTHIVHFPVNTQSPEPCTWVTLKRGKTP